MDWMNFALGLLLGTAVAYCLFGVYATWKAVPWLNRRRAALEAFASRLEEATLEAQKKHEVANACADTAERGQKRAEAALASLVNDDTRRRVIWHAQQLAAHLEPSGISALVGRESEDRAP